MSLIKSLLNAACYNTVPFDLQVALVEPLMCKLLFWHFDHIASQFLGEEVGVTEVLSESAIWLLRYKGCIVLFGRLCSNRSCAHQLMNDGMVGKVFYCCSRQKTWDSVSAKHICDIVFEQG